MRTLLPRLDRWISLSMICLALSSCVSSEQVDGLAPSGTSSSSTPATPTRPILVGTTSSISFGSVTIGSTTSQVVTITNSGSATATIGSLTSALASVTASTNNCSSTTLDVGNSCTITFDYTPNASGVQTGSVSLAYSGDSVYSLIIPATGTGVTATPAVASSPTSHSFGNVAVGATGSQVFVISNSNTTDAVMGAASVTGTGFSVNTDGCNGSTINSGTAACNITVDFDPLVTGTVLGQLTLNYQDTLTNPYTVTVSLTGVGTGSPPDLSFDSSPYNYGNVATNATSTKTFTVSNTSGTTAYLQTPTISGAGYTIASSTCTSVNLTPAATCTVAVTFTPPGTASYPGTLTVPFQNSSAVNYTKTNTLGGTGVAPSTSFGFTGFSGVEGTDVSAKTSTGMTLHWTAQPAASYYKITWTYSGGSGNSGNIVPTSSTSTTVSGLIPNTAYTFKINAYDASDVSDGNNNTVVVTTPNTTGATFNGWSDVVATGETYTAIGVADTIIGNTGSTRLERNLSHVAGFGTAEINTATDEITTNRDYSTGQRLVFRSDTTDPSGLTTGTTYYAIRVSSTVIKLATDAANAASNSPIDITTTGAGNMTLSERERVKIAWDELSVLPSGSPDGYKLYRSTTAGVGFALIATTASRIYTDEEVTAGTTYYYKVNPTVSGVEVAATATSDTEVQVYVPPQNMSLVHRWMANREVCTKLLGKTFPTDFDRANGYRCSYTWGASFGPAGTEAYWDIGYSFVMDRYGQGCNMSRSVAGNILGSAAASGGDDNDVYYRTSTSTNSAGGYSLVSCNFKEPISGWQAFWGSLSQAQRASMSTNQPGFSTIQGTQAQAYQACQGKSTAGIVDGNGNTALRLPRMQEVIAARAMIGVNVNAISEATSFTYLSANDLSTTQGCNYPSSGYLPSGMTGTESVFMAQSHGVLVNGSNATKNCSTRYEVQDLWGNFTAYHTSNTFFFPSASNGYFTTVVDAANTMLEGLLMNGTVGGNVTSSGQSSTGTLTQLPMFGVKMAGVSATEGGRDLTGLAIDGLSTTNTTYSQAYLQGTGTGAVMFQAYSGAVISSAGGRAGDITAPQSTQPYMNFGSGARLYGFRCVGQVGP